MSEPGFTWGDYVSWRERAKDAEARAEAADAELEHWKGANLYPVTYRDAVEENIRLARQVADLETIVARQLTPLDVAVTHIQILRRKGDDYSAEERDRVAAIIEAHATEAREALFASLSARSRDPQEPQT